MRSSQSIFSENRSYVEHDAAIKALRLRAAELIQKVATAHKRASPATQSRRLAEVRALQSAAAYLASLNCPSVSCNVEARKMALSA